MLQPVDHWVEPNLVATVVVFVTVAEVVVAVGIEVVAVDC